MASLRAMMNVLLAVASRILGVVLRVAKRLAAPGAGPKYLVTG
jgi:hypothetical protein